MVRCPRRVVSALALRRYRRHLGDEGPSGSASSGPRHREATAPRFPPAPGRYNPSGGRRVRPPSQRLIADRFARSGAIPSRLAASRAGSLTDNRLGVPIQLTQCRSLHVSNGIPPVVTTSPKVTEAEFDRDTYCSLGGCHVTSHAGARGRACLRCGGPAHPHGTMEAADAREVLH